ncbi:MAG TPA: CBS domain-containing protein [Candidatus Dormibacteraeota bacterium]|nr:CBS domain-containing protein [Candidatus Dormibacteraeota bacterium]
MRAKDAMTSPAITVTPETHCKDAAALLVRHRISALPVVDANGRLVGLVSEADLLQLETTPDPRSQATPLPPRVEPVPRRVDEVMTPEVYTVDEDTDLGIVAQRMLEAGVKRFPVLRGDRVTGVVSRHDLVRVIARTDGDVEAGVKQALTEEGMRLSSVQVGVTDGVVELTGDGDRQTMRLAEILARSVPGVLDVRVVTRSG